MKVITAPEKHTVKDTDILVFLAGGITGCPDWQQEVIRYLQELDASPEECSLDNLVIFNPRREDFPINDPSAASTQISWEFQWLERADILSMYFANSSSDQPICMYELGRNIARMQMRFPTDWLHRIVVSIEQGYRRESDVRIQMMLATDGAVVPVVYQQGKNFHAHRIYNAYLHLKNR